MILIDKKLEEADESQIYTNKDLADLIQMAHKMRMDEIKAMAELEKAKTSNIKSQTNVQINRTPVWARQLWQTYGEAVEINVFIYEGRRNARIINLHERRPTSRYNRR